jgi:hypothetical protein
LNISKIGTSETIKVYPNPTKGILNIRLPHTNNIQITVFDVMGRQVMALVSNSQELFINMETLKSGVYFLKAGNETLKIIKN